MPAVQRKTVRQLINEGAILAVQDGNHGELHPTQEDYVPEGIPFVMASDLKGNDLDLITCKFLPEGLASTLRKGFALPGDVLLTHKGTLGLTTVVPALDTPYIMLTPQVTYYRVNSDALRPEYLHYVFSSTEFQKRLLCHVREGTRPYVGITAQLDLEIEYPNIDVQSAVVEELISLDRLIQISQQSIKHLEEAARLIYTEWFVRLRFPGHIPSQHIDELPQGWTKTGLMELAHVFTGYSFKGEFFNETGDGEPVIRIRDIPNQKTDTWSTEDCPSDYFVEEGDLLIGMDGFFHMANWAGQRGYLVQRTCRIRAKNPAIHAFLSLALERPIKYLEETIVGATVAHLGLRHLKEIHIALPPMEELGKLEVFDELLKQRLTLQKQITQLRQARDLLLPRLISGQLRL